MKHTFYTNEDKKRARLRLIALICTMILLGGINGCATVEPIGKLPNAPVLDPVEVDGLICFTQEDAEELGNYIIELEGVCY